MLLLVLATSESETARKITFVRAGLVGPTLAVARRALDGDGDGYPRLLGGGDCDDSDPSMHPGVLDFPDDGIDQDCDGKDASVSILTPGPFAAVAETVPHDLNFLLITIDTVRADHLGCYGYSRPTSPAIDALAAEGGLFLNGWAHAPSTRYSMPAIATGRWPSAITWDESIWWPRIAASVPTLAQALKKQGYFTAAFYSFDYFSEADHRGFERGVDQYRADRAVLHRAINGPMESRGSSSREMADDAIAFFEAHREQKVFLWLHFYDPHLSYAAPPRSAVVRFPPRRPLRRGDQVHRSPPGAAAGLGAVSGAVEQDGGDRHGRSRRRFWRARGHRTWIRSVAAQTKVPFIVRVPGVPARRISTPAGHVDLVPTMLNLARAPQNPSFLGRSLVADLGAAATPAPSGGGSPPGKPVSVFQEVTSERGKKRGLVTENFHLILELEP